MDRLLTMAEVESITGLRKSAVYNAIQAGDFPAPIKITPKASRWRASEIESYIAACPRGVGDRSRSAA
ncbi:MAG: AlpA family phage regulatory protein [Gammaproteobacteria bacterium]|nr:AlpA family phage regulatory protein [Gammaproteobacteria bacterium]